jgi:potassium-transporting ATPase potassium-binding subunit
LIGSYLQIALFLGALFLLFKPLGTYMARVYQGESTWLDVVLGPVERLMYRASGVRSREEMDWQRYALCLILFNCAHIVLVYVMLRTQGVQPWNAYGMVGFRPDLAFNTSLTFMTNTGWQAYSPESQVTLLTTSLAFITQSFMCAATGMSVLAALARSMQRSGSATIGNFWVDLTRSFLYILLPASVILSGIIISQGVPQTFGKNVWVPVYSQPAASTPVKAQQELVMGPAASLVAIKQLSTAGGGFYMANSAHPLENPTPIANFFEMLAIVLIPGILCYTYGKMVGDTRQGWALIAVMVLLYCMFLPVSLTAEQGGNPHLEGLGVDQSIRAQAPGGNMEGKETRFGIVNTSVWALATTGTGNGSVNSMHGSLMPLSILSVLWLMQLGEVVFGGIGSGVCAVVIFVMATVFVCGLMVGRSPEYLGKKIDAFDMKMISLMLLAMPVCVLGGTAIAVACDAGRAGPLSTGPRAFTEILYAYTSATNTNGSAMAGLSADTPFYNISLGFAMLFGRFWALIPILGLAGNMAGKRKAVIGHSAVATHRPTFVVLTIVVILVSSLIFVPALSLGPVADHFHLDKPMKEIERPARPVEEEKKVGAGVQRGKDMVTQTPRGAGHKDGGVDTGVAYAGGEDMLTQTRAWHTEGKGAR